MRTVVKSVSQALSSGDSQAAQQRLREAERQLRKAASQGVLKKETASRRVARLARAVHKASQGSGA